MMSRPPAPPHLQACRHRISVDRRLHTYELAAAAAVTILACARRRRRPRLRGGVRCHGRRHKRAGRPQRRRDEEREDGRRAGELGGSHYLGINNPAAVELGQFFAVTTDRWMKIDDDHGRRVLALLYWMIYIDI